MKFKFDQIAINSTAKKKPELEDAANYIGLEHLTPGTFEISEWGSSVAPVGEKLLMKKGDVLFGRRRAYQRKVGIAPFDGIFSAHGMVLRPRTEVVDESYFPFFISSDQFMNEAVRISVGSLSPTINWGTLKNCEFDLPPMEEQKKLAELLWAANDLKEKYKKAITATDEMLKAKFREMTYGVDYVCLGEIASEWIKGQSFKKNAIVKDGLHKCIHYGELFTKYGPVIENVISCTNESIIRSSKRGDILFPASDVTPTGLSRCSALMLDNVLLGGDIICMRPLSNNDAQFISYAINQETSQLLKCVSGSIIKHLSANRLKNVSILIPPLALQREFVAIAEKAESAKAALKKSIADIDQVMKGLINQ